MITIHNNNIQKVLGKLSLKKLVVVLLLCISMGGSVFATEVTRGMGFQGQLLTGTTLVNDTVNAEFTFYNAATGGVIQGSTVTKTVSVSNGYFGTNFDTSDIAGVDFTQALWIEVSINGNTLSPRSVINPVPIANNTLGVLSYASAPTVGVAGSLYYDNGDERLYISNGTSWVPVSIGSGWEVSGSDVSFVGGNVGIGTTSPLTRLHVEGTDLSYSVGDVTASDISIVYSGAGFTPNGYTTQGRIWAYKDTPYGRVYSANYFETSSVTDNNSGSPNYTVHFTPTPVAGADGYVVQVRNTQIPFVFADNRGRTLAGSVVVVYPSVMQNLVTTPTTRGGNALNLNGSQVINGNLYSSGFIGVNNLNPTGLIDIQATTNQVGLIIRAQLGSQDVNLSEWYDAGGGGTPLLNTSINGNGVLNAISATLTTPSFTGEIDFSAVNMVGAGYVPFKSAGGFLSQFGNNGDSGMTFDITEGEEKLFLGVNDSTALTINNVGNVGIGTSDPQYKLDVDGDINFTGNFYKDGVLSITLQGDVGDVTGYNYFVGEGAGSGVVPFNDELLCNNTCDVEGSFNTMIGRYAGSGATYVVNSNFFGASAGQDATYAANSNFFGSSAGFGAIYANNSNFFGVSAGSGATDAVYSNFFGVSAGVNATNAFNSNFFGANAGSGATGAYHSNFFGSSAGLSATGAYSSNFLGQNAGSGATSAIYSNFLGQNAGYGATSASYSNFLGNGAGSGATSASYSNFLGQYAGQNTINASNSNFFGSSAGSGATSASNSNFFGINAGLGAHTAYSSNFFGGSAGSSATSAYNSNFFGSSAGAGATSANNSNFFGTTAGNIATNAANSNFLGQNAGSSATSAHSSNFFGTNAGNGATNASISNFFGVNAGSSATNAANSIFIGLSAGQSDTVNNTTANRSSILIGNYTSTGGFSNSIAIGQGVRNSAVDQAIIGRVLFISGIGSSTSATSTAMANGRLGIGTSTPTQALSVIGTVFASNLTGGATTLSVDANGNIIRSPSDESLKQNIQTIENALEKVSQLRGVSYEWLDKARFGSSTEIGIIAQEVERVVPEVVSSGGEYKSVKIANLVGILIEAVKELKTKVDTFASWFSGNSLKVKGDICVDDVCISKEQFKQMLQREGGYTLPVNPLVVSVPDPEPEVVSVPEPDLEPEPDPEPIPELTPSVTPEVVIE